MEREKMESKVRVNKAVPGEVGEFKTLMRNKVFQEEKADGKKYLAGIAKNGEKLLFELPSKECREQTKVILKHLGIRCWEC